MRAGRRGYFVWLWLPVAVWVAVIFWASGQQSLPSVPSATIDMLIKKTGHVLEYALLGLLALRAGHGTMELASNKKPGSAHKMGMPDNPGWLKPSVLTVVFGCLYAVSDEVHQLFVPTRNGQVRDVILDTSAVTLAVILAWLWRQGQRRLHPLD